MTRKPTEFEEWIVLSGRVDLCTARVVSSNLHVLIKESSLEDVLFGDLEVLIAAHPLVVKARALRKRAAAVAARLRHAGLLRRAFHLDQERLGAAAVAGASS